MSKMRTAPLPSGRSPPLATPEVARAVREAVGNDSPDEFSARLDRLERAVEICGGWAELRQALKKLDGSGTGD